MKNTDLMSKVNLNYRKLQKIVFEKVDKLPKKNLIDINGSTSHKIGKLTDDILRIETETTIDIVPEALFTANISYIIEYSLTTKISEDEVESNINELIRTIGPELSFIVSVLTQKMLDSHIILPPYTFFASDDDQEEL